MPELDSMVKFYERLGHEIIQSPSAWWYEVQPKVFLSLPYYKLIEPTEDELDALVKKYSLRAIRYPTPLSSYGFLSSITINTDKNYDFPSLHQKARNQTRRGLENCDVEQLEFDWLIENGLLLNQSTAQRQGRESYYADPKYWERFCNAAKEVEGVTAWGAFLEGRLAAFLVSAIAEGNWQEWIVNHSLTESLNKYPNNALSFTVARHFLIEKKAAGICYGLGSLEETGKLDHFKERMGWTVLPVKQRLLFSSKLSLVSKIAKEPVLKVMNKLFPKNYTVRKASAMVRLYHQQTTDLPETTPCGNDKREIGRNE